MSAESPLHEPDRLRLGALIVFYVCFIASIIVVLGISYLVLMGFRSAEASGDHPATGSPPTYTPAPEPRLQPSPGSQQVPAIDLTQMRSREYREFEKRGWVDPKSKQVRIPDTIANQIIQMSGGKPGATAPSTPLLEPGPQAAPTEPPGQRARPKEE
jgi:hypothetical protein